MWNFSFPKILILPTIICLTCLTTNFVSSATDNDQISGDGNEEKFETLRMVQILHRHGERNPLGSLGSLYPNESEEFQRGWGQLTKKGEKQTFELGRFFRRRYDGFVDKIYKPDEIYVLSSDMDRTIQSAISMLRGLYPPVAEDGDDDTNSNSKEPLSPQLVPIRTVPSEVDNILHYSMHCPKFKETSFKIWTQSEAMKQLGAETAHLLQEVNRVTGQKAKSWIELMQLIDYVNVLTHQNKPMPTWLSQEMVAVFKRLFSQIVRMSFDSHDLRRLRSPTVQKILATMQLKVEDKMAKKMTIYSCHDLTLLAILAVLGFQDVDTMPPYASSLIFELHQKQDSSDYIVELFYRNTTASEKSKNGVDDEEMPLKLEIPNCGSPCFLNRLQTLMEPLYVENYEEACSLVSPTVSKFSSKSNHHDGGSDTCSSSADSGDCTSPT